MKRVVIWICLIAAWGCSSSDFSSSTPAKDDKKPAATDDDEPEQDVDTDDLDDEEGDDDSTQGEDDDITFGEEQSTERCLLAATGGVERQTATINGENCVGNTIDAGGADFNDYHVTISGELVRAGWELFSNAEQDITVNYNLGSPGSTTQVVSMQIVDCDGKDTGKFDVSTGNGTTTLKARKGDRFTIVTSITSGCYGRRDVYDLIKDKDRAFNMP